MLNCYIKKKIKLNGKLTDYFTVRQLPIKRDVTPSIRNYGKYTFQNKIRLSRVSVDNTDYLSIV